MTTSDLRLEFPDDNFKDIMDNIDKYIYEFSITVSDEFYPMQASLYDKSPDRSITNNLQICTKEEKEDYADKFMLGEFFDKKSNETTTGEEHTDVPTTGDVFPKVSIDFDGGQSVKQYAISCENICKRVKLSGNFN